MVSVAHPRKPQETQKRFIRAARAAMSQGEEPVWADPRKLKKMLLGMGVGWSEKGKRQEETQAGPGVPAEGAEAPAKAPEEAVG